MTTATGHGGTAAPDVMDVFDADGDEYDTMAPGMGGSVRSFRASQGLPPDASGDVSLSDPTTIRAGAHLRPGRPDERRQDTSPNGHASGTPDPGVEDYTNTREPVTLAPKDPPARPRQGWTGADPARPARTTRPLFLRLFDKLIGEHPSEVARGDLPPMVAATPRALEDLGAGFPSAGGSTGTQRAGVGPTANRLRVTPARWDSTLPAPPAQSEARAARSFRA